MVNLFPSQWEYIFFVYVYVSLKELETASPCQRLCQSQHARCDTVNYFWLFKHKYSELHLCFTGVEKKQPAGFHRDRKRVALGQEDKQISLVGSPISLS